MAGVLGVVAMVMVWAGQIHGNEMPISPPKWRSQTSETKRAIKDMQVLFEKFHHPNLDPHVIEMWMPGYLRDQLHPLSTAFKWQQSATKAHTSSGYLAETRRKRAATWNYLNFPDTQWTKGRDILYKFDRGDAAHSDDQKAMVRRALRVWEDKTCIRFSERPTAESIPEVHLIFTKGTGCISFVGKGEELEQPIYLANKCFEVLGEILHPIGAAIGLWDEIQRPDRDEHVKINYTNVRDYEASNFLRLFDDLVETRGITYDHASLMTDHSRMYAINQGLITVETRDPHFQRTAGQRVEIAFNDAKLINELYCDEVCIQKGVGSLSCQNSGYQDPNTCNICRCPDGFHGRLCERRQGASEKIGAECGGTVVLDGTEQTIMSPGYDSPKYYNSFQYCVWTIRTRDASKKIDIRFNETFGVYATSNQACYHWVEVRHKGELYDTGPRWCGKDLHVASLRSERDEVLIIFKTNHNVPDDSLRRGFKIHFKAYPEDPPSCMRPCQNGGSCVNGKCQCRQGYSGISCELEDDACESSPCMNQGACIRLPSGFRCRCRPGFRGLTCGINDNDCASRPCLNGGTCIDLANDFRCRCRPGFRGLTCGINDNDCASRPCLNGATCIDLVNGFRCRCTTGHRGRTCSVADNKCGSNPCRNGGTCLNGRNMYVCDCRSGFRGTNCELDEDECESGPCLNGGVCVNGLNSFSCICSALYRGDRCQHNRDPQGCSSSPCQNGGTCSPNPSPRGYRCRCADGFTGTDCEHGNCGGCNLTPGHYQNPCIDPSSTETITTTCTRNVEYQTRSGWFGRRRTRVKCEYYTCTKRTGKQTCCDNAVMLTVGNKKKCAVTGWGGWQKCSGKCGGCGQQTRNEYSVFPASASGKKKDEFKCIGTEVRACNFQRCTSSSCTWWETVFDECACPCCDGYRLQGDTCVRDP